LKLFYFSFITIDFFENIPIFFYNVPRALTFFIENFNGYSGYLSIGGSLIRFFEGVFKVT
jgi:hypothetical protein